MLNIDPVPRIRHLHVPFFQDGEIYSAARFRSIENGY